MNRRAVGKRYEQLAAEYLRDRGFEILETNYRDRRGEIDLIASEGEVLCFVEVKYRSSPGSGGAAEAVDKRKQRTICRVAAYYLMRRGLGDMTPCRFDVVAIEGQRITLYRNAFAYTGG